MMCCDVMFVLLLTPVSFSLFVFCVCLFPVCCSCSCSFVSLGFGALIFQLQGSFPTDCWIAFVPLPAAGVYERWTHVAAVWDDVNKLKQVYVNGTLALNQTCAGGRLQGHNTLTKQSTQHNTSAPQAQPSNMDIYGLNGCS